MDPAHAFRDIVKLDHVDHVKVGDVKDLHVFILCYGGQELVICRQTDSGDRRKMGAIVLDKLDAIHGFFPELEMAVVRGRNNKVVSGFISTARMKSMWTRTW